MSAARAGQSFYYPRAKAELLANIPDELTKFKSWVVWEEAPNDNNPKFKKKPQNPLTLSGKDWNNSKNWPHRATAVQMFAENPTLRGIGFVLSVADQEQGGDWGPIRLLRPRRRDREGQATALGG